MVLDLSVHYLELVSIIVNLHGQGVDFVLDKLGDKQVSRERHWVLGVH